MIEKHDKASHKKYGYFVWMELREVVGEQFGKEAETKFWKNLYCHAKNYTSFLGEEIKGIYSLARKAQSIWVVFVVTNEDPSLTSRGVSVK